MSKTIVEKLNLPKYKKVAVLNKPEGEDSLAELVEFDTELASDKYDLIFAYTLDMGSLQAVVKQVLDKDCLDKSGYLYAAYPKKGNKVYPTYIHRDSLFAGLGADEDGYIGDSSLKFARMVGMNDVFTVVGFKLEARKQNKTASKSKPSQRVDDYEVMIPEVEKDLQAAPEQLAFYKTLTPGYQKDWARYVYSAVQESTRAKRRVEMIKVLGEGYKSMELYRQNKR